MDDSKTSENIERQLQEIITKYSLSGKLSVNKVKAWIYEHMEEDPEVSLQEYISKYQTFFKSIKSQAEIRKINKVFMEAWNSFPHKSLGDLSPNQKLSLTGSDDRNIELLEVMIPPEMTSLLSIKAKIMGLSLRDYIIFVLAKHIEDSITSSVSVLNKIFGISSGNTFALSAPVSKVETKRKVNRKKSK